MSLSNIAERSDDQNTFSAPPTTLMVVSSQPAYFVWTEGKVTQLYVSDSEPEGSADIKKGVISQFQMQKIEGTITEVILPLFREWLHAKVFKVLKSDSPKEIMQIIKLICSRCWLTQNPVLPQSLNVGLYKLFLRGMPTTQVKEN